jgi:hypothetical protein
LKHPAYCRIPGVNLSKRDVGHPTPASAEVKESVEPYLYYLSGYLRFLRGSILTFPIWKLVLSLGIFIHYIHALYSFSIFINYIHSLHSFSIFINYINSLYSFSIFINYINSLYSFIIFIHYIHSLYSFIIFIQYIHSLYSLILLIHYIHSVYSFLILKQGHNSHVLESTANLKSQKSFKFLYLCFNTHVQDRVDGNKRLNAFLTWFI